MERSQKIVLGLDIGGSKIRAIQREGKKVLRFYELPTPKNRNNFVNILKKFSHYGKIGIGVAGIVDGTKVRKSPNIQYLKNFDFKDVSPHAKVDNDARCFLRAEIRGLKIKKALGCTIGTGIGRAYAERGRIKRIKIFEYPEKWEKEYQRIRDTKDDPALAAYLGKKLSAIVDTYKAQAIILGGGVLARKGFFAKLNKYLKGKAFRARFGARAGAIGAALLFS